MSRAANGDTLHPVQRPSAKRRADVRLLHPRVHHERQPAREVSQPHATNVKKGLDGNICRCGTFNRIFEALKREGAAC
jgi:xanthine dehydrogenase iron-sulfur cluster and FAD-binding subunit A